jgi:predicted nucleic acid-binding protein
LEQRTVDSDELVTPTIALAEIAGAIARHTGSSDLGRRAMERILQLSGLRLITLDASLGADAGRLAANHRLRGADAVYVSVAHVMNLPLVSWDREVQSRARGYITILQP